MSLSTASPNFRETLAQLIEPLRRVRPRVPFWQLGAHRVPTLALYRGLLREAPNEELRFRVRALFRKYRYLTGTEATILRLNQGYRYLDTFQRANGGDEKAQNLLLRYSSLINAKSEKEWWKSKIREEMAWQNRLLNRPILTGGYLRATIYNKPLPRMRPQPEHITMMIAKRRRAHDRRVMRLAALNEQIELLISESKFEEGLAELTNNKFKPELFGEEVLNDWLHPIKMAQSAIYAVLDRGSKRASTPYPPSLLRIIRRARAEKVENKTRERQRELRGEILPITLHRKRKGPPAHILARMTPKQKEMDKTVRSVSEVGYVGMVKRMRGIKLRDNETWKLEGGWEPEEVKLKLEREQEQIWEENRKRMSSVGDEVDRKVDNQPV